MVQTFSSAAPMSKAVFTSVAAMVRDVNIWHGCREYGYFDGARSRIDDDDCANQACYCLDAPDTTGGAA